MAEVLTDATITQSTPTDGIQVQTSQGTVFRPRISIADPEQPEWVAGVDQQAGLQVRDITIEELLYLVLTELKIMNYYLQSGLNVPDQPETLRADPTYANPTLNQ